MQGAQPKRRPRMWHGRPRKLRNKPGIESREPPKRPRTKRRKRLKKALRRWKIKRSRTRAIFRDLRWERPGQHFGAGSLHNWREQAITGFFTPHPESTADRLARKRPALLRLGSEDQKIIHAVGFHEILRVAQFVSGLGGFANDHVFAHAMICSVATAINDANPGSRS
jgi:hypothetical protein